MTETEKRAQREDPWLFRTYSGHSSAAASNALYRTNLERGQTGLSVAFDLPTQTGYDSDHVLARGEVGKVGVPIAHLGDMQSLFADIPLERMNTSMTINATAPWLLALYIAAAEAQGAERRALAGTTQNDVIKEYLSRGTYIFPPAPSLKLTADVIAFTYRELPKWNPTNVCSYHLQEAGATPVQEVAYALATAEAVLDAVQASGQVPPADLPQVVGRMSFFVNAGIRFVTEMCKMRAFAELWDAVTRERYGVVDEKFRRFRYGVQVNSLGLTEQQPENNVYRILIEMLAVVLSKSARARAVQLPAWNEALGLPRPWDQQWSLRLQQIVAYETDLLEYGDLFDGAPEIERKVASLKGDILAELERVRRLGGAVAAPRRRRGRIPPARRRRRGRAGEAARRLARVARRRCGGRVARGAEAGRSGGAQRHAGLDRLRAGRRHHRRMGANAARGIRRISRAHRHRQCCAVARIARHRPAAPARDRGLEPARAAAQIPRRQARPRRAFERRRAGGAQGARCGLRGGL